LSTEFNFNTIENYILSPGDIYWIKKSGEEILVSKKGEVPNSLLIKKLVKNEQTLEMSNEINVDVIAQLEELFINSKKEILIQKKNKFRIKIVEILRAEYAEIERSQFEFDTMVWKIFSKFSLDQQMDLVAIDMDLFRRSLRVTSSVVVSAFLNGYYDENFLEKLFMKTFNLLMSIVSSETLSDDVERLENMRVNLSSEPLMREEVKSLFDPAVLRSEVASWEKIIVIFNTYYSFDDHEAKVNILNEIFNNKVSIRANELKIAHSALKKANVLTDLVESA
jgi:murein L,D-transpeptidase YcbB/YkuD